MLTRISLSTIFAILSAVTLQAQTSLDKDRIIEFPDIPGYQTLVCDLHIHTVFSDGSVWPDIRVQEAVKDGVDCIAITDHLEYQPHLADIPHEDRNRAHDIAVEAAGESDLIVIRGSEITRDFPPGHANAIFVQDNNALVIDDSMAVFQEADRQGAFVFWNHPAWLPHFSDGVARINEIHLDLIKKGQLHGIEVFNDQTYSDEALQMALDYDLTILATSDIHNLIDWRYGIPEGGHRPVTLVFADSKSANAIEDALRAGRTAAWFKESLAGREEFVVPLLEASLVVSEAKYQGDSSVLAVTIQNISDAEMVLNSKGPYDFHDGTGIVTIPPHASETIAVMTLKREEKIDLLFESMNAVVAPDTHPVVRVPVTIN